MKAIRVSQFGGPEVLKLEDVETPQPGPGEVLVQWHRAHGMTVIGTAGSDEGRILVLEQGAHHVLDHRKINYLEEALELTGRKGIDVILEMLANVNLGKDLPILAPKGRVVVIGS